MSNVTAHWSSFCLSFIFCLISIFICASLECHAGQNPAVITVMTQIQHTDFRSRSLQSVAFLTHPVLYNPCYYLNLICDLVRGVVAAQDVNSVSRAHCPGVEPCALEGPLTLPDARLWTKTVHLQQRTCVLDSSLIRLIVLKVMIK